MDINQSVKSKKRTWLVTGCAGFIGSHLTRTLLSLDQKVIGLDNFLTGSRENIEAFSKNPDFFFVQGSLLNQDDLEKSLNGVEIVLHQAALGSVPRSFECPDQVFENNCLGTEKLIKASKEQGIQKIVYASSSSVYGNNKNSLKNEYETGHPLSPYAQTKVINEIQFQSAQRFYGLNSIGLRYFNVFGPHQNPLGPYAAVIPLWITQAMKNEPLYINGNGEQTRDFTYIENVVQANLRAALSASTNQIYNIACQSSISLNELFEELKTLLANPNLTPHHREEREGDVKSSMADISKAKKHLGYDPQWTTKQGLKKTVEWFLENKKN